MPVWRGVQRVKVKKNNYPLQRQALGPATTRFSGARRCSVETIDEEVVGFDRADVAQATLRARRTVLVCGHRFQGQIVARWHRVGSLAVIDGNVRGQRLAGIEGTEHLCKSSLKV